MLTDCRLQSHLLQQATVREFYPPWKKQRACGSSAVAWSSLKDTNEYSVWLLISSLLLTTSVSWKSEIYRRWWITVNLSLKVWSHSKTPFSHALKIDDNSPTSAWRFVICQRVYGPLINVLIMFSRAVWIINCMQSNSHSITGSAIQACSYNSNNKAEICLIKENLFSQTVH